MRLLTALGVACCLVLAGGFVAVDHGDPGTPTLTAGKPSLADAALVQPPLTELRAGLSPVQPEASPARASTLAPPRILTLAPAPAALTPGVVTPAALVAFAGHPTRAGP